MMPRFSIVTSPCSNGIKVSFWGLSWYFKARNKKSFLKASKSEALMLKPPAKAWPPPVNKWPFKDSRALTTLKPSKLLKEPTKIDGSPAFGERTTTGFLYSFKRRLATSPFTPSLRSVTTQIPASSLFTRTVSMAFLLSSFLKAFTSFIQPMMAKEASENGLVK